MQTRTLMLALTATLLITVGALAAACGDDSLTLEEYFQQLEALTDETNERGDELQEAFDQNVATTLSEEEQLQALVDFFTEVIPIIVDFLAGVEELRPPEAVVAEHNENVEATSLFIAAMNGVLEGTGIREIADELGQLFEGEGLLFQAAERVVEACLQLQLVADRNEIDVDLDCERES